MALTPGSRLGPYEIVARIGAGGMGEVYTATDTRLSRTVAIKVLPPHWADNVEMKQRFDREARTIASLSDPHICTLHDIGRHEAIDYLVMEYLEGDTLAARIARGPLPVAEALTIAIAICAALDKAHRQRVIHRDLKPSNVMLTPTGAKVLDFGLAKTTMGPASASRELSTPGVVLGTLQYMAPEQLEGADADARTDIFALGVIIHEMLTGKKVFDAKSRVLLMSAIATHEPPLLSELDPAVPRALDHVVGVCLAKDPAERWHSARDVLGELQAIAEGDSESGVPMPSSTGRRGSWRYRAAAAAAVIAAVAVSVPAVLFMRGTAPGEELRFRVPISLSADGTVIGLNQIASGALFGLSSFTVSPDGQTLAFLARQGSDPFALYIRPLGGVISQQLTTVESGFAQPFWSPDGRSIAFVGGGKLKKIAVSGGSSQDLAVVSDFFGGSWNRDGVIIFGTSKGIFRVPAEGGTPEAITSLDASQTGHYWPQFLPDGSHFLYTVWSGEAGSRGIAGSALNSTATTRIAAIESNAVYTDSGHLLFHRGAAIFAQPFDPKTLTLSGEPARAADDVSFDEANGRGHFAASPSGVLAYFQNAGSAGQGGVQSDTSQWHLAWAARTGQVTDRPGPSGVFRGVEVSPDTKRIALHRHEPAGGDIWIEEPSGAETRLTWDASQHNASPIWSPDGRDVAFSSKRNGKNGIYRKRSDGSTTEELLVESELPQTPLSWAPNGKTIVFSVQDPTTKSDLWLLSIDDKKAASLVKSPANETHAQISPDGRWIAYTSDAVGNRREINVQPFPAGAGHWQISVAGGDWPRWRGDSKELYFHSIGPVNAPQAAGPQSFIGPLIVSAVRALGNSFEHDAPKTVLNIRVLNYPHGGIDYFPYALSPDAQRFLYFQFVLASAPITVDPDHTNGLIIARNWESALKK